ncbi:PKD domain-containing protein [Paraferrimonas sedimenticola]|uniref:Lipoprotein n=1 Tax=Paraferrimonas sedimenticola TaxID=375674 RepID=A0AA37RTC6_9GAMM|nr:hypothetical protein [Paraferrimonas sedimenticola]GLP94772.1 hypothetical protein GCM10007895_00780 [Paraferrimonas sedimenticola]
MKRNFAVMLLVAAGLSACGGGSSNDSGPGAPPISGDDGITFVGETEARPQQAIAVWGQVDNQQSRNLSYRWRQVSGPSVFIADPTGPLLAISPPTSGTYQFELSATDSAGNVLQDQVDINVSGEVQTFNVTRDHMVAEGNGVSLRLYTPDSPSNINWTQTAGPSVTLDTTNPVQAFFDSPDVGIDTLLSFRVSGQVNGQNWSDDVHVLVTSELNISTPYEIFQEPVARVKAYKQDSPYASALETCVYSTQLPEGFCNIDTLPLIGQNGTPSLDDIMDKVVVSHEWMGQNFETFLRDYDTSGDLKRLLAATSAVVISYDVRPSFYWAGTAAIYLDPEDLWLTPEQRDTINEAPDYRAGFGSDLQFLMIWRYTKNNDYASLFYPRELRLTRSMTDLQPDLASLLYHELAHANDFLPPSTHASLQGPSLWDDIFLRFDRAGLVSDEISRDYPLTSSEMDGLAQVRFNGETATPTQRNYQPDDVTSFFEPDLATDFYAYSTTREDTAMMFEEIMMAHRFGIRRDVAVTNDPEVRTGDTVIVDWGQRGRVAEDKIQARASATIESFLPNLNATEIVSGLPAPTPMRAGESWNSNLSLNGTPAGVSALQQGTKVRDPRLQEPPLRSGRH